MAINLKNEITNRDIEVVPNPSTNGEFVVYLPDNISQETYIQIYNSAGAQMYQNQLSQDSKELRIKNLNIGFYIVLVNTNGLRYSKKVIAH